MAHFCVLDDNDIVTRVEAIHNNEAPDEATGIAFMESLYGPGNYVQTSYNDNFRCRFAGIGFKYDRQNNVFYEPQPFPSWTLDTTEWRWISPDGERPVDRPTRWDEDARKWVDM